MIDRTTVLRGPCAVKYVCDGTTLTFFTKDDVNVRVEFPTDGLNVAAYGKVDEIVVGRRVSFDVTPVGCFNATNHPLLWPFGSTACGTSIINPTTASKTTERTVQLIGSDESGLTIAAAYIPKMPSLQLSARKTLFGPMTFKGIGAKGTEWTTANSLHTWAASGVTFPNTFDTTDLIVTGYTAAWGSVTGFTAAETVDGFNVDFDMQTAELQADRAGVLDEILQSLSVTVKCKPLGPTVANILAAMKLQDTGSMTMGSRLGAQQSSDLVITGDVSGSPILTVKNAGLKSQDLAYGHTMFRNGEATWVATRTVSAGVTQPLFSFAVKS